VVDSPGLKWQATRFLESLPRGGGFLEDILPACCLARRPDRMQRCCPQSTIFSHHSMYTTPLWTLGWKPYCDCGYRQLSLICFEKIFIVVLFCVILWLVTQPPCNGHELLNLLRSHHPFGTSQAPLPRKGARKSKLPSHTSVPESQEDQPRA
jgi:hypothetical protein